MSTGRPTIERIHLVTGLPPAAAFCRTGRDHQRLHTILGMT
ncbi:hypothetical protein [Streptomyces sp. NPDC058240]